MTRTRRKQNYCDNAENTLNLAEHSNMQKSPEIESYESIFQKKKKILWRPNKGQNIQKTRTRNSKATFQDYLDDSESSEDLDNSSIHSNWSTTNASSAVKIKSIPKTTLQKNFEPESDSDEEIPMPDHHPLVYSPLAVRPGKPDEILDILHENHVRGLERSHTLDAEDEEEFVELIPCKEVTENLHRSSTKNLRVEKKANDAEDQVRESDIFRKSSVSFNQKTMTDDKTLWDSPLKGTVRKEAKKKLFAKPSKNVPGSFSTTFVSVNQEHGNSTLKNRTNHIVSRFTKQFKNFDRLAFLSTPHQLRELRSPEKPAEDKTSPLNKAATENPGKAASNNRVNPPPPIKTKVSISFSKPGAPETVTSYPSPIQKDISGNKTSLLQPSTTAEQPTLELPIGPPISPEIRKATPQKRKETINEAGPSVAESEQMAVNPETQTSVSPNKFSKIDVESNTASVNVSITLSPLKTVDGSADLGDKVENLSPEKTRKNDAFGPNRTLLVRDQAYKECGNSHEASQSQQAPLEIEPSLDEETTAGLMFEKEMRERKMKKQTPHIAPQVQSQFVTDGRETNVYRQNEMNYCTMDYDPAVPEDPIQVCNITNIPSLRVNSWKLLPGMSKPVTRLGSSLCHVTALEGKIELQVTQKNGKIVKIFLSAHDVACIPEDSIYEVKNIGAVTSVVLVYHLQSR